MPNDDTMLKLSLNFKDFQGNDCHFGSLEFSPRRFKKSLKQFFLKVKELLKVVFHCLGIFLKLLLRGLKTFLFLLAKATWIFLKFACKFLFFMIVFSWRISVILVLFLCRVSVKLYVLTKKFLYKLKEKIKADYKQYQLDRHIRHHRHPEKFHPQHQGRELWRKVLMRIHHAMHLDVNREEAKMRRYKSRRPIKWGQVFWSFVWFIVTSTMLYGCWWFYADIVYDLPDVSELRTAKQDMTTKIYDRNGELLFEVYGDENRSPVSLSQVSPDLINATIAIEDRTFRTHYGFDPKAILRAFLANQETGSLSQGGSTLTQQLVKQRLLTPEKTFKRKIKELILAMRAEETYSKNEILEMYLNQVNYGGAIYGVEQASQTFFGKSANELTLAESAFLAGLPQAPSRYSPFMGNLENSYKRRTEVLRRMREDGYITEEQEAEANEQELTFSNSKVGIKAPHFVMYVRQLLAEMYGEEMTSTGGLKVYTTLDLNLQNAVQEIVTAEVNSLANYRISNGAAMVTHPSTGEILAMVGSRDYFDFDNDGQVNVAFRLRQPGSSIKPLMYATAMEYYGFTPATVIQDTPVTYSYKGGPSYTPRNYDNRYHGNVTLRTALANSYNIPAVKVLNEIGKDAMADQAQRMGITTWEDRSRFGLSLALGAGEVYMTEMMGVYGTFANYGVSVEQDPFLEILDYKDRVLYRNECALDSKCENRRKTTLSPAVSYQITSILSDNTARTPAFGANSVLNIPGQEVAVKTGTTNSMRDNWTFGYTTDYVVGTWVGNNDNSPMSYVASGITGASPIWQKIMLELLDPEHPHHFGFPGEVTKVQYCGREEVFKNGQVPPETCAVNKPPEEEESYD